jgi:rare lipoprotein A
MRARVTRNGPVILALAVASLAALAGCATLHPKTGQPAPAPKTGPPAAQVGVASYYAKKLEGRRTASGERYDMKALTAAHPTLPFGSRVRVTNLHNGKSVVVRINDRGPYAENRVIDLSYAAARELQFIEKGTTRVRLEVVESPPQQP